MAKFLFLLTSSVQSALRLARRDIGLFVSQIGIVSPLPILYPGMTRQDNGSVPDECVYEAHLV